MCATGRQRKLEKKRVGYEHYASTTAESAKIYEKKRKKLKRKEKKIWWGSARIAGDEQQRARYENFPCARPKADEARAKKAYEKFSMHDDESG